MRMGGSAVLANIPATQTVIEISRPGGPEVLVPATRPVPEPKAGEVLIRIAGAGINRADCLQRMGRYPMPPGAPDIPGLECSGTVVKLGDGVTEWKDRRPGLRADDRRRLRRVCRGAGGAMPAGAGRASAWSMPAGCPRRSAPCGPMCSSGCTCSRARRS